MKETSPSRPDRSYAILGTGALGGFYGSRLQRAGLDVHFLVNSDYQQVCQSGLVVESVEGDFTLNPVKAYQDVRQMPPCDVVVVTLKTTNNHLLPQLLPPVLKDSGVVLILQNGLGVEAEVAKIVGDDRVMGGVCYIGSNKVGPGHIRHLGYEEISLGDYGPDYQPQGITKRMVQIAGDWERAGITIEMATDLLLVRWRKLVWNIPFNGLSVVLDARTDEMMASLEIRNLVEQLMREVVAGAERYIPNSFIDKMLYHTEKINPYNTSMKLDYDRGKPLEVEAIFGNPLRAATSAGADWPRIAMLYQQLQFLNAKKMAEIAKFT
ncbi:MAG: putative 2-dehydropantoate 2-reductase [Hormoscilla sp. GM102CHS1]|nr:putative 2-dehydropantoate 2-reductase [Hormoscilla sp. GM102CHS1]